VGLLFICPRLYQSLYPDKRIAPHFFLVINCLWGQAGFILDIIGGNCCVLSRIT
jgi:hypothetical protein